MTTINFFREPQANIIDRIVQWTLTYGRLVIMITYTVALVAFLFRFTIDFRLTNLHDQIRNDEIIVKAMSDSEALFRNLQNRLDLIGQINNTADMSVQRLNDLVKLTNSNVTFVNLSISPNTEVATISTNSIQQLNSFVTALKKLNYVMSINIENIQNKVSLGQVSAIINISTNAPAMAAQ